jgi:undecaprenyl-diphosphatase
MAVVILFWSQIWPFTLSKKERGNGKGVMSFVKMDILTLWFKILVACVPAAVIGVLFDDVFDALFYNYYCVAIALIVFGVAFIIVENWNKGRNAKITKLSEITYQTALMIGVFQLIAAVFPGTSRSGATIVGALLIGVSRTVAAEFTFFLAIPVMFGASLLKLVKFGFAFTGLELALLLIGTVVSFVVSLFVLRFLMGYIKKHDFKVFGWYRIVLGIVVLVFFGLLH